MGSTALGWVNQVAAATLTETSAATGFGAANLASDQCAPSTGWQTADGVLSASFTATFATAAQSVRAVALVNTNLTAAAAITVQLYLAAGPTLVASATPPAPAAGYGQVVALFSQAYTADYAVISITDAANPQNHINVGGAFIGALWVPSVGAAWDSAAGRDVRLDEATSIGGQEYPLYRWQRRRYELALPALLTATEVWAQLGELDRTARLGGNVLLVPDLASSVLNRETIYGRLTATSDVTYPFKNTGRRAWRARITERL